MYVDKDEYYPYYYIRETTKIFKTEYEIPTEIVLEWTRIEAEFQAIQHKLGEIYDREEAKRRAKAHE